MNRKTQGKKPYVAKSNGQRGAQEHLEKTEGRSEVPNFLNRIHSTANAPPDIDLSKIRTSATPPVQKNSPIFLDLNVEDEPKKVLNPTLLLHNKLDALIDLLIYSRFIGEDGKVDVASAEKVIEELQTDVLAKSMIDPRKTR